MEECCELCEKRAVIRCDSDQAKLCWDCDEKVHNANFLVAKHTRVLLCRLCQSLTPWKASGPKLTPTVSFCHCCVANGHARLQHMVDDDGEYSSYADSDYAYDGEDDDEDRKEEKEGEEENQVVPWFSASGASASSPPDGAGLALKRMGDSSFSVDSDVRDKIGCSSTEVLSAALPNNDESTSMSVFRPLKKRRIDQGNH